MLRSFSWVHYRRNSDFDLVTFSQSIFFFCVCVLCRKSGSAHLMQLTHALWAPSLRSKSATACTTFAMGSHPLTPPSFPSLRMESSRTAAADQAGRSCQTVLHALTQDHLPPVRLGEDAMLVAMFPDYYIKSHARNVRVQCIKIDWFLCWVCTERSKSFKKSFKCYCHIALVIVCFKFLLYHTWGLQSNRDLLNTVNLRYDVFKICTYQIMELF